MFLDKLNALLAAEITKTIENFLSNQFLNILCNFGFSTTNTSLLFQHKYIYLYLVFPKLLRGRFFRYAHTGVFYGSEHSGWNLQHNHRSKTNKSPQVVLKNHSNNSAFVIWNWIMFEQDSNMGRSHVM